MHQVVLALVLSDGGRDLWRATVGLMITVLAIVLVIVALPLTLIASGSTPDAGTDSAAMLRDGLAESGEIVHPFVTGNDVTGGPAAEAVDIGRRYLGVPYVFGGTNPAVGLDCSGLVQLVYRQLGIGLPRTAQAQFDATDRVRLDQLQPGDLVFFARTYVDPHDWITHVGIYMGNGRQLNAPTEGQVVSIQPVFGGYWGEHFFAAGRVRDPRSRTTHS